MFLLLTFVVASVFGILTSRSDFASGLVRNRLVFLFSLSGLLLNTAYGFGSSGYLFGYLSNALFTFLVGFSLWWFHFWSAADAKLLSAYSLLLPLGVYSLGNPGFFPSQLILVNTFVSAFLLMSFRLFSNITLQDVRRVMSKITEPRLVANLFLVMFGFSWAFGSLLSEVGISSSYFLSIFFIFLVLDLLERFTPLKAAALSSFFVLMRIVFDFNTVFSLLFLQDFFILVFVFWFLRYFVLYLGFYANSAPVSIQDLAPGMAPVEMPNAIPKEGKYGKHELFYSDLLTLFSEKKSFPLFSQIAPFEQMAAMKFVPDEHRIYEFSSPRAGLGLGDVAFLKKLGKDGKLGFDSLRVSISTPFAHILFGGVLLTYLANGNFFVFLFRLLTS